MLHPRSLLLVCATAPSSLLFAQAPPLETDRPDQTESPAIVPVGWLQVEAGCQREESLSPAGALVNAPTVLTKVGLASWVELRILTERTEPVPDLEPDEQGRWQPLELGAKFKLARERGLLPRTAIIAHATMPGTGTDGGRPAAAAGDFRFTMQHTLSDRFALGYNLGAEWDGERPTTVGVYTLTVGARLNDRWSAYGEVYGFISDSEDADHRWDTGLTCLLGENVQLDASGGRNITGGQWFISVGISFRLALFSGSRAPSPVSP